MFYTRTDLDYCLQKRQLIFLRAGSLLGEKSRCFILWTYTYLWSVLRVLQLLSSRLLVVARRLGARMPFELVIEGGVG